MTSESLKGKCCAVGITGGIAAYKVCGLISLLKKNGAEVRAVMTENAARFITPLTIETLTGNQVVTHTFAPKLRYEVEHVSLAARADAFIVAPATANFIGKYAAGIADDFLTTAVLAFGKAPLIIAPAMNSAMLSSAAVRRNLETLAARGTVIIPPARGRLACGGEGDGRLPEPETLFEAVAAQLFSRGRSADYAGKTVLITSGGTRENIDGVRFIGNRSGGKTGAALADAAARRGARVIVVSGASAVLPSDPSAEVITVNTTEEMRGAVMGNLSRADYVVMAAAPADYRLGTPYKTKLKGEKISLELVKNPDIAAEVGKNKGGRKTVIFCAETGDPIESALEKLKKKNADLVVANDVSRPGAGFDSDNNAATVIGADGGRRETGLIPKTELAEIILDELVKRR